MQNNIVDKEVNMLRKLASAFPRHPLQINQLLQSDAEIIDLTTSDFKFLVLKTDGLHEEISEKLYEDPYLIGWMAVTVTMSDMAAVGSKPLGLLLGLQLPRQNNENWLTKFQQGINEACAAYGVSILGGDTNFCSTLSVSTTGVGTISKGKPLLRKGMVPGEHLYATGKLGLGSAFAYARYFDDSIKVSYQPLARLKESKLIRDFASACMDTSDGLFPALSVLSEINSIGIQLTTPLHEILHDDVLPVFQLAGIPSWMFLAGPHGEYELLFTIPVERQQAFEQACIGENWQPVYLGKIIPGKMVHFIIGSINIECQPATVANLFSEANGDIPLYFELLKQQHKYWSQS